MKVAIYLRKSREDERMERELGKGETLTYHRRDLFKHAKSHKFSVIKVYEELVSGESILYRPAMLELLKEVEQGLYDGVLCMDMQRLGRGDMEEQGVILKAFKKSGTKIITLNKTYDLENEFDEEYSEFEAFMSRKEYKMINKRLRRGVMRSVEDGNYNGPWRPFGYEIKKLKEGRTLEINAAEAGIVRSIYNWYTNEHVGSQIIADRLNLMGVRTSRGNAWSSHAVAELVKNPLYHGKIAYNRRYGYRSTNKKKAVKNRPTEEWLLYPGKHEAIISEEIYNFAIDIMNTYRKSPVKPNIEFVNPLAGIVVCGICGAKMVYRTYNSAGVEPHIMCRSKCGNKSAKFSHVERILLDEVSKELHVKRIKAEKTGVGISDIQSQYETTIKAYERQLNDIKKQRENAYDFLEKGIYTVEVFTERLRILDERYTNLEFELSTEREKYETACKTVDQSAAISTIESVLAAYAIATPPKKNMLLKTIIEKAVYLKDKKSREDNFSISLTIRL